MATELFQQTNEYCVTEDYSLVHITSEHASGKNHMYGSYAACLDFIAQHAPS